MSGDVLRRKGSTYNVGQEEGGIFENVAERTAMTMLITDVLGEALGLPDEERRNLNLAAWGHDSGKKTERMWQKSIEQAETQGETAMLLQEESEALQKPGARKK